MSKRPTNPQPLTEDQCALLNQQGANAILTAIDCLYSYSFEGKPLSDPNAVRNLANFLSANMDTGMLIEDYPMTTKREEA